MKEAENERFGESFGPLREQLVRFALRQGADVFDAEDAAQATLMELLAR